MKLLILSTADNNYATQCIVKAARDRGHTTSVVDPVQLYLFISNVSGYDRLYKSNKGNIGRINLKDYGCIIPRLGEHVTYGAFIVEQLNKNLGIPSVQSATGIRHAADKLLTLQLCSSAGLATPRTVYLYDTRHLEYLIEKLGGYPIIVKLTHGSGGTGVALLKDRISAIPTIQSLLKSRSNVILQEYIDSHGKDYRVIVIGNKVIASYQRSSVRGDFRANLQQGGSGSPVTLEQADKEFCIKAARVIDLAVAGIDIIKDKSGKTFLLEANANFGFKVQQITGINVARQIILFAEELVKKGSHIRGTILLINLHEVYKQNERDDVINFIKEQVNEFKTKNKYRKNAWNGFCGDIFFYSIDNADTDKETKHVVTELIKFSIKIQLKYREIGIVIRSGFDNKKFTFNKRIAFIGDCFERIFNLTQMPISRYIFLYYNDFENQVIEEIVNNINTDPEIIHLECNNVTFDNEQTFLFDLHKNSCHLFNIYSTDGRCGSSEKPINVVYIEYRDREKLINRLSEAVEVTFVGITHEQTRDIIIAALDKRNNIFWDRLTVIFPSLEYIERVYDHRDDIARIQNYNNAQLDLSNYLLANWYSDRNRWEIRVYDKNLPFTGTKLILNVGDRGNVTQLRIAPILIGENFRETHYVKIWEGMRAFNEVNSSFEIICNNSSIQTEWNLFLGKKNNTYYFNGLIQRRDLNELRTQYIPAVLIILYENHLGVTKLVLQKRDKFNSRDKFDKYCNISGLLNDLDVIQSIGKNPSKNYKKNRTVQPNQSQPDLSSLFSKETGIKNGDSFMDEKYWKIAAIREIEEELNVRVGTNQLESRGNELLELSCDNYYYLLRIFSIQLGAENVPSKMDIETSRPKANLHYFNLQQLDARHREGEFAPFLNTRYIDIFKHIFANDLMIS